MVFRLTKSNKNFPWVHWHMLSYGSLLHCPDLKFHMDWFKKHFHHCSRIPHGIVFTRFSLWVRATDASGICRQNISKMDVCICIYQCIRSMFVTANILKRWILLQGHNMIMFVCIVSLCPNRHCRKQNNFHVCNNLSVCTAHKRTSQKRGTRTSHHSIEGKWHKPHSIHADFPYMLQNAVQHPSNKTSTLHAIWEFFSDRTLTCVVVPEGRAGKKDRRHIGQDVNMHTHTQTIFARSRQNVPTQHQAAAARNVKDQEHGCFHGDDRNGGVHYLRTISRQEIL